MLEEWKRRFERTGEVTVRASRRGAAIGVAAALVMFGVSMVLLLIPGSRYPLLLVRTVGWVGAVFFGVGLVVLLRSMLVPPVLLHLDRGSLTPRHLPPAGWEELLGAQTVQTGGWTLARLEFTPGYWARITATEPSGGPLRRWAMSAERRRGEARIGPMVTGGGAEVVRLVLWARQQIGVGGPGPS